MSIATIFLCILLLPQLFLMDLLDLLQSPSALMEWFLSASILIAAVLLLRWLLKDKVSCRIRYALWAVVLVRLLLPVQFELPVAVSSAQLAPEPPAFLANPVFTYQEPPAVPEYPESETEPDPFPDAIPGYNLRIVQVEDVILFLWRADICVVGGALILSNAWFDLRQIRRRRPFEVPDTPIPVYVLEGLPSPCLFGPFRPAVYLAPEDAADAGKLRHILAHELTHYAHKDHIWAVLRCLCLAIHWFNPLVWIAVVLSKRDCELACDEGAVQRLGESERIAYGRTLVDMVAQNGRGGILSCSTTMTEGKKTIQQRIERLVQHPETKKTALFLAASLVAVAAVFTFAGDASTAEELGIPTSEEAYAQFTEQLENDLSASWISTDTDTSTISSTFHGEFNQQAKQLLRKYHAPLSASVSSIQSERAENASRVLHLDYVANGSTYSSAYYVVPLESKFYLCLEDWDWDEHRWLIPVATISEDTLSALDDMLQQQAAQTSGISNFFTDLDGLFHVFLYDSSVDVDRYAFFLSVSEQSELDDIKQLLRNFSTVLEDTSDIPKKPTADYILLDTDASTSPSPEYMIRVYADYGNVLYQTGSTNTPIATVSDEVITELRKLADPDRDPKVVMGITILGYGGTQYELNDPEQIAQLSKLLLSDDETVAQNQHPCYDMTDWLSNWTVRYYVEYGMPIWSKTHEDRWYVRAIAADNSSFYSVDIPGHLVDAVLDICEQSES